ncbi:hypothetical protein WJ972_02265 [Achromobacter insuavis]
MANASLEMAGQDEVVAELVRRNFQRLEKALERILAEGQASGEIDAGKRRARWPASSSPPSRGCGWSPRAAMPASAASGSAT